MKRKPTVLRSQFYRMVERLVTEYCEGAPVCIDRTPTSLKSTFMPRRKYIYISRDGRDVLVSWCYHALRLKIHTQPGMLKKQEKFDAGVDTIF